MKFRPPFPAAQTYIHTPCNACNACNARVISGCNGYSGRNGWGRETCVTDGVAVAAPAARSFFKFVVKCAGSEGTRAAELYHWSAMTFGGHWRRRVAVEIGRGRVACLRRSGDRGFEGNSSSEAETAFDSM